MSLSLFLFIWLPSALLSFMLTILFAKYVLKEDETNLFTVIFVSCATLLFGPFYLALIVTLFTLVGLIRLIKKAYHINIRLR